MPGTRLCEAVAVSVREPVLTPRGIVRLPGAIVAVIPEGVLMLKLNECAKFVSRVSCVLPVEP